MDSEDVMYDWKSISLTHVEYQKGDNVGMLLAWCSLLPIFILVSLFTLVLFRRDLHTIFFLSGFVVNEVLNYILKHLIKEPRPFAHESSFTKYGMPSSHAQFSNFFASYIILLLYIRLHHNSNWWYNIWKHCVTFLLIICAFFICYSRTYLLYHSTPQVLCGSVIGVLLGVSWFIFNHFFLSPLFPYMASWKLCEWLMLRDTTLIPNITWFEYCTQRTEANNRLKKKK